MARYETKWFLVVPWRDVKMEFLSQGANTAIVRAGGIRPRGLFVPNEWGAARRIFSSCQHRSSADFNHSQKSIALEVIRSIFSGNS